MRLVQHGALYTRVRLSCRALHVLFCRDFCIHERRVFPPRPVTWDALVVDENRDSPERDMVNPSTDSYMWPIRGAP